MSAYIKTLNNQSGDQIFPRTRTDAVLDTNNNNLDTLLAQKSSVSVSPTGTSTDEVQYITIDGVEKKIGDGGSLNHAELDNLSYAASGHTGFQAEISDLNTIRSGASAGATAYQKPVNGIPARDIATGVIPDISEKENKGKMTISGTERTVVTHILSITDSGITTNYTLLGV